MTFKKQKEHLLWAGCVTAYHHNGLLCAYCEVPDDELQPVTELALSRQTSSFRAWCLSFSYLPPVLHVTQSSQ